VRRSAVNVGYALERHSVEIDVEAVHNDLNRHALETRRVNDAGGRKMQRAHSPSGTPQRSDPVVMSHEVVKPGTWTRSVSPPILPT
jgi:hypothetical protein